MSTVLELTNLEAPVESCIIDINSKEVTYHRGDKKVPGFTGLYYKDDNTFFALYPSKDGPTAYFEGSEYKITSTLSISLIKSGKDREFRIDDYGIEIHYEESSRIGFDVWSDEIDVDLFFMIEQRYQEESFYDRYTLSS